MISVVCQSTAERLEETRLLFEKIKPYLDKGWSYRKALIKVGRLPLEGSLLVHRGWGRDLIEYGKSQGYVYGYHEKNKRSM